MNTYKYVAKDLMTQKKQTGEIDLESAEQVKKYLMDKNLFPISIKKKTALNSDITIGTGIRLADINFFCKQFAAMIQAGISIAKGIEICAQQSTNKVLKKHLENIHDNVSQGSTLSEAVKEEGIFPDILQSMIECGDASGNLEVVLKRTVDHFDNQLGVQKKVKKALSYPILVLVVAAVVVAILMVKVVPSFLGLLNDTGAEVPGPTKLVVAISNFMVNSWGIMLGMLIAIVVACSLLIKVPRVRRAVDLAKIKMPLFGDLTRKSLSATFSSTMSMLVQSGIPMLQAMEITKKVMGNKIAEEELIKAMEELKQGSSLLDAISSSKIFQPILFSMVKIGEESGALDEMLIKVSDYFKEEVEVAVDAMIAMIEPMLTILLAFVVGGIMLAVMLPTFSAATAVL